MEPDDLLCSRNAQPPKASRRTRAKGLNQPPSLGDNEQDLEGLIRMTKLPPPQAGRAGQHVTRKT